MTRWMRATIGLATLCSVATGEGAAPPFSGSTTARFAGQVRDATIPDGDALIDVVRVDLPGVVVDVDVALKIRHTTPDHLDMLLVSPQGTVVPLATDLGGGADHVFADVVFDDQAPSGEGSSSVPCVRNVRYQDNVPLGSVQPEGALSVLVGEAAAGPWALVVIDDTNGTTGQLQEWALELTTLPALPAAAPPLAVSTAVDTAIPDNSPAGLASPVVASGLGRRLLAARITVDIAHPRADHLDLFLVGPSGRRIDLATDIGGGAVDLFAGTTFDDRALEPVSDASLPAAGEPFAAVVPEGALAAFLGEDPNGSWTLEVVDDTAGQRGTLRSWTLELTATAPCGDGVLDAGEQCDDGNSADGDGCEHDCTPTPADPAAPREQCETCSDADGDGLVSAFDPDCMPSALAWETAVLRPMADGTVRLRLSSQPGTAVASLGPVVLLAGDAGGLLACSVLGHLERRGRGTAFLRGRFADGTVRLRVHQRSGKISMKGHGLRLGTGTHEALAIGLGIGDRRWAGSLQRPVRALRRGQP